MSDAAAPAPAAAAGSSRSAPRRTAWTAGRRCARPSWHVAAGGRGHEGCSWLTRRMPAAVLFCALSAPQGGSLHHCCFTACRWWAAVWCFICCHPPGQGPAHHRGPTQPCSTMHASHGACFNQGLPVALCVCVPAEAQKVEGGLGPARKLRSGLERQRGRGCVQTH